MTELEARTVCIDLDGTVCRSVPTAYADAEPIPGAVAAIRQLRRDGWIVVLYTARHFNHWKVTKEWLSAHEIEYDQIVFGKPPARYYVDDRAIRFDASWPAVLRRLSEA